MQPLLLNEQKWVTEHTWGPEPTPGVKLKGNTCVCTQCSCVGKITDQQLLQNPFSRGFLALKAQSWLYRYPNLPAPLISASFIIQRVLPGLIFKVCNIYDVCHSSTGYRTKIQRGAWVVLVCKERDLELQHLLHTGGLLKVSLSSVGSNKVLNGTWVTKTHSLSTALGRMDTYTQWAAPTCTVVLLLHYHQRLPALQRFKLTVVPLTFPTADLE